jgi:hypothetical protein
VAARCARGRPVVEGSIVDVVSTGHALAGGAAEGGIVNVVWMAGGALVGGAVEGGIVDVVWTAGGALVGGVVEGGVVNVVCVAGSAAAGSTRGGDLGLWDGQGGARGRLWSNTHLVLRHFNRCVLSHPDERGTWVDVGKMLLLSGTCGEQGGSGCRRVPGREHPAH